MTESPTANISQHDFLQDGINFMLLWESDLGKSGLILQQPFGQAKTTPRNNAHGFDPTVLLETIATKWNIGHCLVTFSGRNFLCMYTLLAY